MTSLRACNGFSWSQWLTWRCSGIWPSPTRGSRWGRSGSASVVPGINWGKMAVILSCKFGSIKWVCIGSPTDSPAISHSLFFSNGHWTDSLYQFHDNLSLIFGWNKHQRISKDYRSQWQQWSAQVIIATHLCSKGLVSTVFMATVLLRAAGGWWYKAGIPAMLIPPLIVVYLSRCNGRTLVLYNCFTSLWFLETLSLVYILY